MKNPHWLSLASAGVRFPIRIQDFDYSRRIRKKRIPGVLGMTT